MTKTIADEATCGAEDATARHVQRTDPSWRENEIVDSILKLRIKNLPTRHIVLLIHFKSYYQVSFGTSHDVFHFLIVFGVEGDSHVL